MDMLVAAYRNRFALVILFKKKNYISKLLFCYLCVIKVYILIKVFAAFVIKR